MSGSLLAVYHLTPYGVPVLLAGTLNWLLGAVTLRRERGSRPSLTLLAMTGAIGLWLFGLGMAYSTSHTGVAEAWIKASMVGTCFVPLCAFLHAAMGSSKVTVLRAALVAGFVTSTALATLTLTSNLLLDHVHRYFWGYYPVYGALGPLLIAYYALFFVSGGILYRLGQTTTRSETQHKRMRIRFAALIVALPATLDFLPTMGIGVYPVGFVFILGYIGLSTYSIWRYRLVDITPALASTQIINTMVEALIVVDRDGVVRLANRAAEAIWGGRRIVGATSRELGANGADLAALLEDGAPAEVSIAPPEGDARVFTVSRSRLEDHLGAWVGTVLILHDISARRASEDALRASESMYRALVEMSPDAVIVTDATGVVTMVNSRAHELTGMRRPQDGVRGRNALEFVAPGDRERLAERIRSAGAMGTVVRAEEYELIATDGERVPVELSISIVPGADGERRIMTVVRDIRERRRAEEQIRYLAYHDALTGAATRAVLMERLAAAIDRAPRGGASGVGVIYIDLDGFKAVNDLHGHDAGDALLRSLADELRSVIRPADTLARVGGDEFVLLVPGASAREVESIAAGALAAARRARGDAAVSASVGVAMAPRDGDDPAAVLKQADAAMYFAKRAGGDRVATAAELEADNTRLRLAS